MTPTVTALLAAWHSSTCAGCTDLRAQVHWQERAHQSALRIQARLLHTAEDDRARQRDEIAALEKRIAQLLAEANPHEHVWQETKMLNGSRWTCRCLQETRTQPGVAA